MWQAVCIFSCFAVTVGCGTMYAYSAYAPQLSDRLALSASTISSIGMVGNFAMSVSGPLAGWIVDTKGFLLPIIISVLTTFTGYTIVRTAYQHAMSSVPVLAVALVLIGLGATHAFSASVKCAAVNFPQLRGTATAVAMSGYGLSAFAMSVISGATSNFEKDSGAEHILTILWIVPTLLMCVFGPVIVASQPRKKVATEEYAMTTNPPERLVDRINERTQADGEIHGLALLRTPVFWAYFVILGLLSGMGQAYIYTCGYMVKALAADAAFRSGGIDAVQNVNQAMVTHVQAHQVAILSLANCSGRLLNGTISDTIKNKLRLSRLYALLVAVGLCFASMIITRKVESLETMWLPTFLAGLFYGACFGAFPGIISDSFGVTRLSSNWGLVALAPIPFSYFFTLRIGHIYDAHSESNGVCIGSKCFQGAYTLHTILTGVVLCLIIYTVLRLEKTMAKRS